MPPGRVNALTVSASTARNVTGTRTSESCATFLSHSIHIAHDFGVIDEFRGPIELASPAALPNSFSFLQRIEIQALANIPMSDRVISASDLDAFLRRGEAAPLHADAARTTQPTRLPNLGAEFSLRWLHRELRERRDRLLREIVCDGHFQLVSARSE